MKLHHNHLVFIAAIFLMVLHFIPAYSAEPADKEVASAHAETLLAKAKKGPGEYELKLRWMDRQTIIKAKENFCRSQHEHGIITEQAYKNCQVQADTIPEFWLANFKRVQDTIPSYHCFFSFDNQLNPVEWYFTGCRYNK